MATITQWNFNSPTPDANTSTGTTAPAIGTGTATLVGGTTATFASGDASGGSSDPATGDDSGWNVSTFPAQSISPKTAGVQFSVPTTGFQNITVSFDQRHSNTAANRAVFQYSTDGTNFTDLTAFTATAGDTWNNGRTADLTTIPAVNNNPNFAFRIVSDFAPSTTNYAPSNPTSTYGTTSTWRFDMVTVSGDVFSGPTAGVTITESSGSTNVTEGGPTDTYTVVLNTAPTANVTININPGTQVTVSPSTLTFTSSNWNVPQTVTVTAVDDAVLEGNHTGTITHTAASTDTNYNAISIASITANITDNDGVSITKIHAIQGNATTQGTGGVHNDVSPLNGQTVTIEGIVTADFQLAATTPNNVRQLRGFFIQEETADQDGDPSTSEGIFVFTGDNFLTNNLDVQEGQKVQVTGTVSEFFGMTQITASTSGSITVVDSGNNLSQVTPATINLPVVGDINDYYEQFEGMKVTFSDKLVVSEYFELARYGQIVLTADERPFQYTHIDNTPTQAEYTAFLDNLARKRIILDDDDNTQNSPLTDGVGKIFYPQPGGLSTGTQGTNFFRGGDSITGLTGVLHWSFAGQSGTDAWRVRPTQAEPAVFTVENPRPATPANVGGNIKVASFNVLNYFTTIDTVGGSNSPRGADSPNELDRQTDKLVQALKGLNADVFGLIEVENNGTALEAIVDALNNEVGANTYKSIQTGVVGTDAITVAFVYKQGVVAPKGNFAVLNTPAFTDPNGTGQQRNRPAIAQTFEVINAGNPDFGAVFNVVVNHLKSKGSGTGAPADNNQNDGQGASNDTRTKAAQALAAWLATDPTGQGDSDWLIIGDLNAYKGEAPITALKNAGYTDLTEQFGGSNAYSYLFNGQLGYLDHALGNSTLLPQVTGVTEWHINADEVPLFDYNNTIDDGAGEASFEAKPSGNTLYEVNAFRTSDHDPVLVGLDLIPDLPVVNLSVSPNSGSEVAGTTITVAVTASKPVTSNQTVNVTLSGTNVAAADFTGIIPPNLTIPAGQTQASFTVNISPDTLSEGTETAIFTISSPSAGIVLGTTTTANLTITDFVFAVPNAPGSGVLSSSTPTGNLILGNNSNNAIAGGNLNDTIAAFAGDDVVFGFGGNDSIDGGLGNDTLNGGVGNDTLIGSVGNNQLTGGLGADVFVIRTTGSFDTVVDFEDGIDRIRTSPATTFSTLVGPGFLNATPSGANTLLSVNGVNIALLLNFNAASFSGADLI